MKEVLNQLTVIDRTEWQSAIVHMSVYIFIYTLVLLSC